MTDPRIVQLTDLPLESVIAHGGRGRIDVHRPFDQATFASPIHFVDFAVLPPGSSIGIHRHGNDEELYLVLEGEGLMTLDDEEHRVKAGSLIRNVPHGSHGLLNDGASPLRLFVIEVGVDSEKGGDA